MKVNKIIQSFNAGELSPLLDARTDQAKYNAGCRTMENFYPLIHGGAERRPGTYYVGAAKTADVACRVVPFVHSISSAYVLEFGNQYIRFYTNGGRLVGSLLADTSAWADATAYIVGDFVSYNSTIYRCIVNHTSDAAGPPNEEPDTNTTDWIAASLTSDNYPIYEIVTPYLTADLFKLKFEHSNDIMWITHPDYEPRKLSRTSATTFTLTVCAFTNGPFQTMNDDTTLTITPTEIGGGGIAAGASVTLTASSAVFDADHAPDGSGHTNKSTTGCLFKLVHPRATTAVSSSFAADGNSSTLTVYEDTGWDFTTTGIWTGTVKLQRSYDGGTTYETIHTVVSEDNANAQVHGTEEFADATYRMNMSSHSSGTAVCTFSVRESSQAGVVKITAFTSSTEATATVITALGAQTATYRWAEGYWSDKNGWPATVAISAEERLCFGGSTNFPLTICGSKANDYYEMKAGTDDDDAFVFTLVAGGKQNAIKWMVSKNALIIGTEGGEHVLGPSAPDEALTPTNVKATIHSTYGSADVQGILINDAVIFVQRGGRKLREMRYFLESDSYNAEDLTIFSNHVTESAITDVAFQRTPDPMIWCVRTDGEMAVMSYERYQKVFSWSRVVTSTSAGDSDFESVAVIPSSGEEDEIWVSVERVINGSTVRYIEYFSTRDF